MSRFGEFLATDCVREELIIGSGVGLMALHGGFEFGTRRLARSISDLISVSLYTVVQPAGLAWHLPSTSYDRAASPNLHRFLEHVRLVVSFHGYHRPELPDKVLLGGTNRSLAAALDEALGVEGVPAVSNLAVIPKALRGQHARNPVNIPIEAGVQVELPRSMRRPVPLAGIVRAVSKVLEGMV
ncbi:MAG: poly-gamma-glutamate hydrolase family protein [Acidimicrobiia bacterium]|nr:poly-gamma-glutamate hydrolase family protein [Acidimicrobiia bacterium]